MTLFARYYNESRKLVEVSMDEIDLLIKNEINKAKISDYIFHRYYDRYLKIFDYKGAPNQAYIKPVAGTEATIQADKFNEEYKNGFTIMTVCCLLIETISTFFEGQDQSRKTGKDTFKFLFEKAKAYNNQLQCFISEESFYKNVRCGLLHQGETYGKFKIRRTGILFDKANRTINATRFHESLKDFLNSYQEELKKATWDSEIWDNCRVKVRHIILNSR